MEEPIRHFYKTTGFDKSRISRYALGEKFTGVMLDNGRIGICSTLGVTVTNSIIEKGIEPDLDEPGHRIILNAYFNAVHNYTREYEHHSDIFDAIDFKVFRNIVMVGFFESLYNKFNLKNISLKVFDRTVENEIISPLDELDKSLADADAVIVTGTTLFNTTFLDIVNGTSDGCKVLLLGPSNILHNDMLKYRNVQMVFGSVFDNFDYRILDQLEEGLSARQFLKVENKVFIEEDNITSL